MQPEKEYLEKLREYALKRSQFGEIKFAGLCDRIQSLSEDDYFKSAYHPACYKDVVHVEKLKRAEKRFNDLSSTSQPKKGRPSTSVSNEEASGLRIPRRTEKDKSNKCIFQCSGHENEELHLVSTDTMGEKFLKIKKHSPDEVVRISLAYVNQPSDCAAFDLVYHHNCLRDQERKIEKSSQEFRDINFSNSGQYIANIDILNAIKCSLSSGSVITMNDIDKEYKSLLEENGIEPRSSSYKQLLKEIIKENIDDAEFVKSHRAYDSEQVLSKQLLSSAVTELRESQNTAQNENDIKCLSKAAAIIRRELASQKQWKFRGSMADYEPPPQISCFVKWVLIGTINKELNEARDNDVKKTVSIVSQQFFQNFRTDRQTKYEPRTDEGFKNRTDTPLSVGTSLSMYKRTRSKYVVNMLSNLHLGTSYSNIVQIEKRIMCGVFDRIQSSGGYCLPLFVKKGKSLFFAADNIDFLEIPLMGKTRCMGLF